MITTLCRSVVLWSLFFVSSAMAQPTSAPVTLRMPVQQVTGRERLQPKVVMIRSSATLPGLDSRLRAELDTLGLELVPLESHAQTLHGRLAELGARAADKRAIAALRIEQAAHGKRLSLWLYDAVTSKMLFRQVDLRKVAGTTATASISVQATELIHASLLELNLPAQRARLQRRPLPRPVAKVVRPLTRCRPPTRHRFFVEVGPSVVATIGGAGPAIGVLAAASWRPLRWLGIGLEGFVPLTSASVQARDGGSATVAPLITRLAARVIAWRTRLLEVGLSGGFGALVGYSSGGSNAVYIGQSDWGAVPATFLALRLRLRFSSRLSVSAAGGLDVSLYPLHVRVERERLERLGPVLAGGALTLTASF